MGKRWVSAFAGAVLLLALMPVAAFAAEPAASFGGGTGLEDDPYLIENEAQLRAMGAGLNDGTLSNASFKLTANIDLAEAWDAPCGTYSGTFDGGGRTISGLVVNGGASQASLFGMVKGRIVNLGLADVAVTGGNYAGALASELRGGVVSRCFVSGAVSGNDSVGGLVGAATGRALIENCYSTASVTGSASSIGGIAGFVRTGVNISYSYSTGMVQGKEVVGGIVGNVDNYQGENTIKNCAALGSSVIATSGASSAGRVWGNAVNENVFTASNNYGFAGMSVGIGSSDIAPEKGAETKDGADASATDIVDASWWQRQNGLGFMAAPLGAWTFSSGNLPVLMGEKNPIPTHIASEAVCTVSFDVAGGSAVEPQTVKAGSKVAKPVDPVKSGATFGGWCKDSALTVPWDFESDTVACDTTLYAKWTALAPVYVDRTIVDEKSLVQVSGKLTEGAVLEVAPLSSGAAYQAVLAQAGREGHDVLSAYEVRLTGGSYEGALRLSFPLDRKHDGKTVTVRHLKADGTLETMTAECANGKVLVSVGELSSFALTVPKDVQDGKIVPAAEAQPKTLVKTGDTSNMIAMALIACVAFGAVALGAVGVRKRSE
ncbi:MAG: hypothetical protein PEGG_00135 [Paraeggerthella hongkongensis]